MGTSSQEIATAAGSLLQYVLCAEQWRCGVVLEDRKIVANAMNAHTADNINEVADGDGVEYEEQPASNLIAVACMSLIEGLSMAANTTKTDAGMYQVSLLFRWCWLKVV
jgi:hypothetical protein